MFEARSKSIIYYIANAIIGLAAGIDTQKNIRQYETDGDAKSNDQDATPVERCERLNAGFIQWLGKADRLVSRGEKVDSIATEKCRASAVPLDG